MATDRMERIKTDDLNRFHISSHVARKIEKMSERWRSIHESRTQEEQYAYQDGAMHWGVWCTQFEDLLVERINTCRSPECCSYGGTPCVASKTLKEYRLWLHEQE